MAQTKEILDAGKRPFLLGGEHLVTLGAMRAVAKRCPTHVSIWMHAVCATTIWAQACPTRALSAAAGTLLVTDVSSVRHPLSGVPSCLGS
ncbi:MAG: arginase family protein [Butyricicoccus sp.]